MNIYIRSFNDSINSKTGAPLPPNAPRRGTPEWLVFQDILIKCLQELGHVVQEQKENPLVSDLVIGLEGVPLKKIYVHKCKRDVPQGDLFYMQMHMRYLFTIDTQGWGADHSGKNSFDPNNIEEQSSEEFCRNLSDELLTTKQSKHSQPDHTPMTPSRYILVPIQIPRDYTIKHHSPITVKYFIDSIQAWAEETRNHVGFKLHPCNTGDHDLISAVDDSLASNYCHKLEGNIHELIKRSDGLFVINSGTGFEALVHGKPVCTFGNCDYNLVTHNADIRRLDEARNFIYSYSEDFRRIAFKYVYWYHKSHAFDVRFPEETVERLTTYLKGVL